MENKENKVNSNDLSFTSNNDKGNFNQVLFDYKNYNGNKPIKRKNDNDIDEEEKKEIKNQIDLINKQKKKGWIQKEEPKKEIKLESYVNESIKENKDLNNSEVSLLSLGRINEELNKEKNMINNINNDYDILKKKVSEKKLDINVEKGNIMNEQNKPNEKKMDKINSNNTLDDLLLLDKIIDNNINSINSLNNINSINNINNINSINNFNNINNINSINNLSNSNNKKSQEGFDLDFNSNVQSKDKSYNFNNNLILLNSNNFSQKFDNQINNNNDKIINQNENKNNISKYQEYLKFKKLNNSKSNQREQNKNTTNKDNKNIEENNNMNIISNNNINMNNYELIIKTQEDQKTYDEFYKMNHNKRNSVGKNNKKNSIGLNNNIPENSRVKKEREKMKGYKCELCQKFYDCVNEDNPNFLCQECSRHRTDAPINKTPQGFYDLSI